MSTGLHKQVVALCRWPKCPCGCGLIAYSKDGRTDDVTTDLNACAKLIDGLADKGWTCRLDNGLDKTWECTFETGTSGQKDFRQIYRGENTLPLAICTAFVALEAPSK